MGIGVSVFLIALGAILTFAVDISISGLDIQVVGVILMIAGILGLLVTLVLFGNNRRSNPPASTYRDRGPGPGY